MNTSDLFKQLSSMQARMAELQEELAGEEVVGESGGGLVRVVLNGKSEAKGVEIDASLAGEDLAVIGGLVAGAFNAAVRQLQTSQAQRLGGALGLPNLPGMPQL